MPAADRVTPKTLERRRKVPEPTKRQVKQAQGQARQYGSQGQSVERTAQKLKRARRTREHEARDVKSSADLGRAKSFKKTDQYKKVQGEVHKARVQSEALRSLRTGRKPTAAYRREADPDTQHAGSAPVLRVLEQTTRPLHGIAAGTREGVRQLKKGRTPLEPRSLEAVAKAGVKGLKNEDKSTFSDVLKDVGVKNKAARGAAGFALDVAADPTTYVTFGAGGVAKRAAQQAGKQAQKKALRKGLSKNQAASFSKRAERQALAKGSDSKGVVVKLAGREVPGVRKATAKATKPIAKATRPIRRSGAGKGLRDVAADVRPSIHRADVSRESHERLREAARRARSKTTQGEREAVALGEGIRKKIGPESYAKVVDAIEAGRIRDLPDDLARHAHQLRSTTRYLNRTRKRAGIQGGEVVARKGMPDRPREYVPRQLTDDAIAEIAKPDARGKVRGGTTAAPMKSRKEKRRLALVREEKPGRYREDIDALYAQRYAQGARSTAQAELNRAIANEARPVKRGQPLRLAEGEAVFHVKGSQAPRRVTDRKELERATTELRPNKAGTKLKGATPKSVGAGRYVVAREKDVAVALKSAEPTLKRGAGGILSAYDKAQGGFKSIALATPGYHVRNLVGDTMQAYTQQPARKLPGNLRQAGRLAHEMTRQDKARRALKPAGSSGKTLKTKRYGDVPLEEATNRLVQAGAARSGFTSRELRELTGTDKPGKIRKSAHRVKETRAGKGASRFVLNREDLPRLATAVAALQKGATWDEAAKRVADTHFDYSDLSEFERNVARRIAPFYTWSSRNIPYQAKTLVQKPGKYANFQKVREEAAKAIGADEMDEDTKQLYQDLERAGVKMHGGWEKYISEWEQRQASVPVSWKGGKFTVSAGLPVADLNEFPGAALAKQLEEYYQKGMSLAGPMPKNLIEYFDNHSFFFRDQLERDHSPLVPAPEWAKALPKPLQEAAGLTDQHEDKKTGKKILAWRGKADYIFKSVPGTPQFLQQLAVKAPDAQGRSKVQKLMGWAGLKVTPVDAKRIAVNSAYARLDELNKRINLIKEDPAKTAEVERLKAQRQIAQQIVYSGRAQQGYKVLPKTGGGSGGRTRSSGGSDTDLDLDLDLDLDI